MSSVLGVAGVLYAVVTYLDRYYSSTTLSVDKPLVVEFRCSTLTFDSTMCFDRGLNRIFSHMSLTAALYMTAKGSDMHQVSVARSTVTVQFGDEPRKYVLSALWTADFVPGQEFRRQEVVTTSIRGGQSVSREVWYLPLAVNCDPMAAGCSERDNFLTWTKFWNGEMKRMMPVDYGGSGANDNVVHLAFAFLDSEGKSLTDPVACDVVIGDSAGMKVKNAPESESLYLTLPCR